MNLVKEKQGGLVDDSPGLKRWPFKLIKHFADTTRVSPSPAGPVGYCPLNFLNLIILKFRVRASKFCMQLPWLTSWLSFVVSTVSLSLSHWYPGSGVVLDCIDS